MSEQIPREDRRHLWQRVWKQAAKYWYSGDGYEQVYEIGYADGYSAANDDASGRLELLRRCEKQSLQCPVCGADSILNREDVDEQHMRIVRSKEHAPDCDLAAELGEQPAETEEFDGGGVA